MQKLKKKIGMKMKILKYPNVMLEYLLKYPNLKKISTFEKDNVDNFSQSFLLLHSFHLINPMYQT